jgi:chromosome segregation ATPase
LQAIAAFESVIRLSSSADSSAGIEDLIAQNAALAQKTANLERDISALSSQGSDQVKIITEYITAIQELESANMEQQQMLNRRETEIQALAEDISRKDEEVLGLNNDLAVLRTQHNDLQRRLEAAIDAYTKAFSGE